MEIEAYTPRMGEDEYQIEEYDDYRYANYKLLRFIEFGEPIFIEQNFMKGKGGTLWDAAYILSRHI